MFLITFRTLIFIGWLKYISGVTRNILSLCMTSEWNILFLYNKINIIQSTHAFGSSLTDYLWDSTCSYYESIYILFTVLTIRSAIVSFPTILYFNEQCMNHIMYADDICVIAPTAIALQKLLDVCFEYSIANDLLFNPVNSVCIVFKPCRFKLYCPTVSIGTERLTYVNTVKYLGFVFCENKKDNENMLKQMMSLYAKSNKVIRMFNHCTVDVKLLLIKSYCTSFYCGYLWSDYKAKTFSKLRVAFNNVYRRVLRLPTWSSASEMYDTHNI